MIWLLENWVAIISTISIPIAWIFGGKQAKKVEIKNSNGDFLNKVQTIYDSLVDDLKADRDELKACNIEQDNNIKELRNDVRSLQKQFNDLYLAYAKEVEASKYWKDKFDELEGKYIVLERDHEALKKQFENYKKANK
jgi:predicted RNase H-like nuclease (RuvC/YqgF family)